MIIDVPRCRLKSPGSTAFVSDPPTGRLGFVQAPQASAKLAEGQATQAARAMTPRIKNRICLRLRSSCVESILADFGS